MSFASGAPEALLHAPAAGGHRVHWLLEGRALILLASHGLGTVGNADLPRQRGEDLSRQRGADLSRQRGEVDLSRQR